MKYMIMYVFFSNSVFVDFEEIEERIWEMLVKKIEDFY